jgi:long-chain acyl-CoA synthetase
MDPKGVRAPDDPTVMTFQELLERGRELERVEPGLLGERLSRLRPEDTGFIIYTSGTTGPPKGAMHSYATILDGARLTLPIFEANEADETIVYLPLAHAAERLFTYTRLLLVGGVYNFVETPETLFADMREIAPTLFLGVPRTWEKLKSRVEIGMTEATWLKRIAYRWALEQGRHRAGERLEGTPLSPFRRVLAVLAEWVVLRKLRERMGLHRVRYAFTGAAPIAPEVIVFFWSLGVRLYEALGQTETGTTAVMPKDDIRLGTIGKLVDGLEARISEDGELLFRSPGIFKGYLNNAAATRKAMEGGWFHTGDKAEIDEDGYVTLHGRVVDMFVLSTGRNIAPQNLENMLKASDYIMDAVLVGNGKPYLTCLVVLDEETVSHHAQSVNVPFSSFADLASRPEIHSLVQGEVDRVNGHWSDREQILDFRILRWELSDEEEELTPTMKVRRKFMCLRYRDLIEEMYASAD